MPNSHHKFSPVDFVESNFDKLVSHKVKGIWKTLQEASDNLYTCDQLLGDYNELNLKGSVKDSCTQTDNSILAYAHLVCTLCGRVGNNKETKSGDHELSQYYLELSSRAECSATQSKVLKRDEALKQIEVQNVIYQELKINLKFFCDEKDVNIVENVTCKIVYPEMHYFNPMLLVRNKSSENVTLLLSKKIIKNISIQNKFITTKVYTNSHFTINLDSEIRAIVHNALRYGKTYSIVIIIKDDIMRFSISQWLNFMNYILTLKDLY